MPRPTSKEQLLNQAREEYTALTTYLDTFAPEQKIMADVVGEWSVKDMVAHLTEWSQMVMSWYAAGKRGEMPHTPAEGYTWQQIPALNQKIYEQHRDDPWDDVLANFSRGTRGHHGGDLRHQQRGTFHAESLQVDKIHDSRFISRFGDL